MATLITVLLRPYGIPNIPSLFLVAQGEEKG